MAFKSPEIELVNEDGEVTARLSEDGELYLVDGVMIPYEEAYEKLYGQDKDNSRPDATPTSSPESNTPDPS